MCTNYVLVKTSGATQLAERLGVSHNDLIYGTNFKPGSLISIVTGSDGGHVVRPAIWWLYLQQTAEGLKPHKDFFSVNTNYRKVPKKPEYRQSRCIIPATAFVESQDGKKPHLLKPADGSAIAFGGLYKEWVDKVTGELVYSASIITLAGINPLKDIHRKSMPLWLPEDAYEDWLSPAIIDTSRLDYLLEPALRCDLMATPIDRTYSKVPAGEAFLIPSQF
ncbi:SOS response-associated peptidase [Halomonas binhaiensis]|uniref:Abasic site processing protein n=1 Tax=Halomonas binhaiensis TaxID=2562282 RepID=A0A5C1N8W4_9GAMM|nr:SOS response-associated peptidase family protein [Halomonas binhaiensis]QEM80202.1 SOS response-associated peptidase family protein [Halomonas binhaiensis]